MNLRENIYIFPQNFTKPPTITEISIKHTPFLGESENLAPK